VVKTGCDSGNAPNRPPVLVNHPIQKRWGLVFPLAPDVEITVMTKSSPELAVGLMQGKIDVALLRREVHTVGLAFRFLSREPLIAILPTRHRLARHRTVPPQDLAPESFIN